MFNGKRVLSFFNLSCLEENREKTKDFEPTYGC